MILTEEDQRTWRKTCLCAPLSTTNSIWTHRGTNPCVRGERTVTNHLSHSMAMKMPIIISVGNKKSLVSIFDRFGKKFYNLVVTNLETFCITSHSCVSSHFTIGQIHSDPLVDILYV
jgi:hypothetical protein